jgi:hypothetical protein
MSTDHDRVSMDDPRTEPAIEELKALIRARYPETKFQVSRGEDPEGVYLAATVDVEDVDEVMTLYTERLIELQVEDRLPLYVLSLQPFERVVAVLQQRRERFPQLVAPS